MDAIPKKPVGNNARAFFFIRVWDLLFGGRFPLKGKGNCKVEWASGYYWITAAPPGNGVKETVKTSPFKGLWNSDTSYQSGDIVIVQSGVACGVYISTVTPNYNQSPKEISGTNWPDTGNGWMQLSAGPINGQWY